jgi:hypothetical protein
MVNGMSTDDRFGKVLLRATGIARSLVLYVDSSQFASKEKSQRLVISMSDPLDKLNSKIFAEQLHTNFKVHAGDAARLTLELSEVNERQTQPKVEAFSLLFRGPQAPRLAQQIHRFEHEKLGAFDLFLTAVGADEEGTTYEVVFHRLRKKQP